MQELQRSPNRCKVFDTQQSYRYRTHHPKNAYGLGERTSYLAAHSQNPELLVQRELARNSRKHPQPP